MSTTNAKHTPGPWEISDGDPDGGIYIEHNDAELGTFTIAHMHPAFSMDRTPEAFAADCELIAQAPTMAARIAELEAQLALVTAQRDRIAEAAEAAEVACDQAAAFLSDEPCTGAWSTAHAESLSAVAMETRAALATLRAEGGAK